MILKKELPTSYLIWELHNRKSVDIEFDFFPSGVESRARDILSRDGVLFKFISNNHQKKKKKKGEQTQGLENAW